MDLNEQLKGWLQQQAQPGSFIDKAGLGLAKAGQTIGQDAAAGAAIMNDPRNSWIVWQPLMASSARWRCRKPGVAYPSFAGSGCFSRKRAVSRRYRCSVRWKAPA